MDEKSADDWRKRIHGRLGEIESFHIGYFDAMLFADDPAARDEEDGGEPIEDTGFSEFRDISPELWESSVADCDWFLAHPMVARALSDESDLRYKAGTHLWYTRQGHGTGFWEEGEWPGLAGEILLERAEALQEVSLYLGEDGLVYGL